MKMNEENLDISLALANKVPLKRLEEMYEEQKEEYAECRRVLNNLALAISLKKKKD